MLVQKVSVILSIVLLSFTFAHDKVSAGKEHYLIIKDDGSLWVGGKNDKMQLGIAYTDDGNYISNPYKHPDFTDVKKAVAGENFSVILNNDGTVYSWGVPYHGQLGHKSSCNEYDINDIFFNSKVSFYCSPSKVSISDVTDIAAGTNFVLALKSDGTVWGWGDVSYSQLGNNIPTDGYTVTPVQLTDLSNITSIAAGADHAFAVENNGSLLTWGNNAYGQLGIGQSAGKRGSPQSIPLSSTALKACGGSNYSAVLLNDNTVATWGYNANGRLGLAQGTSGKFTTPQAVPSLTGVQDIACGSNFMVTIGSPNNSLHNWGADDQYQLGDGETTDKGTPVQIFDQINYVAVAAGSTFALGVQEILVNSQVQGWEVLQWGTLKESNSTASTLNIEHAPVPLYSVTEAFLEDHNYSGVVTAVDLDENTLTFSLGTAPDNGTLTIESNGSFFYQSALNVDTNQTFTYIVNDGTFDIEQNVTLNITPVNDAPLATSTTYTTIKNTVLNSTLEGYDVDGDTLTFTIGAISPSHGNISIETNGSFTYTPDLDSNTTDSFLYYVTDPSGLQSSEQNVTITIQEPAYVFTPPSSQDFNFTTPEDVTYSGNISGTDADGQSITFTAIASPSNGTLTLDTNGTFSYKPTTNYNGSDSFTYKLSDEMNESGTYTATITVTPVNDAPTDPETMTVYLNQGESATGTLTVTDVDGDSISFAAISSDVNGTFSIESNGTYTYTPTSSFFGTDSIIYTASDSEYNISNSTLAFVVNEVEAPSNNRTPEAIEAFFELEEDSVLTGTLKGLDIDGDTISFAIKSAPENGAVTIDTNGSFTYVPNDNYNGDDSFDFAVTDSNGATSNQATVSLSILAINDAPTALTTTEEYPYSTYMNEAISSTLLGSDIDSESYTFSVSKSPSNGNIILENNGTFTYTPTSNYLGYDVFNYIVTDTEGASSSEINISVLVQEPDGQIEIETSEEIPVSGNLISYHTSWNTTAYELTSEPMFGSVQLDSNSESFIYTPNQDFAGKDVFFFKSTNGSEESTPRQVSITVLPINDAPVLELLSLSTLKNITLTEELKAEDVEGDKITYTLTSLPSNGEAEVDSEGVLIYTPNQDFVGEDTLNLYASDGSAQSDTIPVTITVKPANDAPTATLSELNITEDSPYQGYLTGYEPDGDTLTYEIINEPSGDIELDADSGFIIYIPMTDSNAQDSFTYTVDDGDKTSEIQIVTINIKPVNDAPVATDAEYSLATGNILEKALQATDAENDPLTYNVVNFPSHGNVTFESNGSFSYEPQVDENGDVYLGTDAFSFTANDGEFTSGPGTVIIKTYDGNIPPEATFKRNLTTYEDVAIYGLLTGEDENDAELTFSTVKQPSNGTLKIESNGSFTYQPELHYFGEDSFSYTVNDGELTSTSTVVNIKVMDVKHGPEGSPYSYTILENQTLTSTLSATDYEGEPFTYMLINEPSHGTVSIDELSGEFIYTPTPYYNGEDNFIFAAKDEDTVGDLTTITIVVEPVNNQPIPMTGTIYVDQNTTYYSIMGGYDNDGDTLLYEEVNTTLHGELSSELNGTYSYTPNTNYTGVDRFYFLVNDQQNKSNSLSDPAKVLINIYPVDDSIQLTLQPFTTDEDTPYNGILSVVNGEGKELTYIISYPATNGTVTVDEDGNFTYTPKAQYSGVDGFRYKVNDGVSNSPEKSVLITVRPINDAPIAPRYFIELNENETYISELNATDEEGDALTYAVVNNVQNGTLALEENGSYSYVPLEGFTGIDSFSYNVSDGNAVSSDANVTFYVVEVDNPPVPTYTEGSFTGDKYSAQLNGQDPENRTLIYSIVQYPEHGSLTLYQDGTFDYVPAEGYSGTDTFIYNITDGVNDVNQSVTLNVTYKTNEAPVGTTEDFTLDEDTLYSGEFNATDAENDALFFAIKQQPKKGQLKLLSGKTFSYMPRNNFYGDDAFTYTVSDGEKSTKHTVKITVNPINDAPKMCMYERNHYGIVAGENYSLLFKNDGTVWGWGLNNAYQLGENSFQQFLAPKKIYDANVSVDKNLLSGTTHHSQVYALDKSGLVWTWGNGIKKPEPISTLSKVNSMSVSETHALASKTDGSMWAWGSNSEGSIPFNSDTNITEPIKIENITDVQEVAAASGISAILTKNSDVYLWGKEFNESYSAFEQNQTLVAYYPFEGNAKDSSGNNHHGYGTTLKYTPGVKGYGASFTKEDSTVNVPFNALNGTFQDLNDSWTFSAWVTFADEGINPVIQFGGHVNNIALGIIEGKPIFHIEKKEHNLSITGDKLDVNTTYLMSAVYDKPNDNMALFINGIKVASTELGEHIANTGTIEACIGSTTKRATSILSELSTHSYNGMIDEVKIYNTALDEAAILREYRNIPLLSYVKSVSAGKNHIAALRKDGTVWVSGNIEYNQFGMQDFENYASFTKVEGLEKIKAIASADNYTLALKSDNTVWVIGTPFGIATEDAEIPVMQIEGLANITEISASSTHALFLKSDGTVWTMATEVSMTKNLAYNFEEDNATIQFNGDALRSSDGVAQLTPNEQNKAGIAIVKKAYKIEEFETRFSIYLGDNTSGADGIVFAMLDATNTDFSSLGSGGKGMGMQGLKGLAVEFDTWKNGDIGDPNGNHIGINVNGEMESVAINSDIETLEDGNEHDVVIRFNNGLFSVFLDGTLVLEHKVDNFKPYDGYFAIASGTGSANNLQYIDDLNIHFGSKDEQIANGALGTGAIEPNVINQVPNIIKYSNKLYFGLCASDIENDSLEYIFTTEDGTPKLPAIPGTMFEIDNRTLTITSHYAIEELSFKDIYLAARETEHKDGTTGPLLTSNTYHLDKYSDQLLTTIKTSDITIELPNSNSSSSYTENSIKLIGPDGNEVPKSDYVIDPDTGAITLPSGTNTGEYKVIVLEQNNAGEIVPNEINIDLNSEDTSGVTTITTTDSTNNAPYIEKLYDLVYAVQSNHTKEVTVPFYFTDEESGVSFEITTNNDAFFEEKSVTADGNNTGAIALKFPTDSINNVIVTIKATDTEGLSTTSNFRVAIIQDATIVCLKNILEAITLENILGENPSQRAVTSDLNFDTSTDTIQSVNTCSAGIEWKSSQNTIISTTGTVIQPDQTRHVHVRAVATGPNSYKQRSKGFVFKVLSNSTTDEDRVNNALRTFGFRTIKATNSSRHAIYADLDLTTQSIDGVSVSYSSSDESVINAFDGVVTRGSDDSTVTLSANFSYGDYNTTKDITLTVKKSDLTPSNIVTRDMKWLSYTLLLGENSAHNEITDNLTTLPTEGPSGSTITWSSSNSEVINTSGEVSASEENDIHVNLTATLQNSDVTKNKKFSFKVLQQSSDDDTNSTYEFVSITENNDTDKIIDTEILNTNTNANLTTRLSFISTIAEFVDTRIESDRVFNFFSSQDRLLSTLVKSDGSTQVISEHLEEEGNSTSSLIDIKIPGAVTTVNESNVTIHADFATKSVLSNIETNGSLYFEIDHNSTDEPSVIEAPKGSIATLQSDETSKVTYNATTTNTNNEEVSVEAVVEEDESGSLSVKIVKTTLADNNSSVENFSNTKFSKGSKVKIKNNANNGFGNGDQDAPGNSASNNNAENSEQSTNSGIEIEIEYELNN